MSGVQTLLHIERELLDLAYDAEWDKGLPDKLRAMARRVAVEAVTLQTQSTNPPATTTAEDWRRGQLGPPLSAPLFVDPFHSLGNNPEAGHDHA